MGGLALPDLRTEMGISQLKLMRNAIWSGTEVGKMLILSLKYSQIEAGIKEPLLEKPGIPVNYLTSTWTMSVRQFLFQHNLTITLTDQLLIRFQGPFDACIMQPQYLMRYTPQQKTDINLVRLYLQVMTLSDVSDPTGKYITEWALKGTRKHLTQVRRNWPHQEKPTIHQIKIWNQYITSNFIRFGRTWKQKLGTIRPNTWKEFNRFQHTKTQRQSHLPIQYKSIRHYLHSLPNWHKRLLANYIQKTPDKVVWKCFRSKQRTIEIISDGGLAEAKLERSGGRL
jgi:hypothetical protein